MGDLFFALSQFLSFWEIISSVLTGNSCLLGFRKRSEILLDINNFPECNICRLYWQLKNIWGMCERIHESSIELTNFIDMFCADTWSKVFVDDRCWSVHPYHRYLILYVCFPHSMKCIICAKKEVMKVYFREKNLDVGNYFNPRTLAWVRQIDVYENLFFPY